MWEICWRIWNQCNQLSKYLKPQPEETISKRVKLMPQERKKDGKWNKILAPNEVLAKLPIISAQIKAGNNSSTLESEKCYSFCITIIKPPKNLQQINQVIKITKLL